MMKLSENIRTFAVCETWRCHVLPQTLRIKKETLSSFRDSDKTAKNYQNTRITEEHTSVPSYQGAGFLLYCWVFGCLAVPIESQKQRVSVPFYFLFAVLATALNINRIII